MNYVIIEKARKRILYYYVDFDKTLAYHRTSWGIKKIGPPVPEMIARVKKLIDDGEHVKIFTGRASDPARAKEVQDWLVEQGLPRLEVTNIKGHDVKEIWDDRARQVESNKGIVKE